jgi:SAM-dependent methyltransferase
LKNSNNEHSPDRCWCGCELFEKALHPEYIVCGQCGTAKLRCTASDNQEYEEIYAIDYWYGHQKELGFPIIDERARSDLSDRCVYWLRHILMYADTNSSIIEVGCGHGGLLSLLQLAGYPSVMGIELDDEIVRRGREWFDVTILRGPLREVESEIGPFNVAVLMDVLEHFLNPVSELRETDLRLTERPLIFIQTPEYRADRKADWQMFAPPEHIFLFTKDSLCRFLKGAGYPYVDFLEPRFSNDMFCVAAKTPIHPKSSEEIVSLLKSSPNGRIVLALLDLAQAVPQAQSCHDPIDEHGIKGLAKHLLRAIRRKMNGLIATRHPDSSP